MLFLGDPLFSPRMISFSPKGMREYARNVLPLCSRSHERVAIATIPRGGIMSAFFNAVILASAHRGRRSLRVRGERSRGLIIRNL
jgi:hypothetical protein